MTYWDNGSLFSGVYFCNPGEYKVQLDFNFSMHSSTSAGYSWGGCASIGGPKPFSYIVPQIPNQAAGLPSAQFNFQGQPPARLPHCDSGSSLYYQPESSSGMEESYASGLSNKGIPSNSWCFTAPNQNPYEHSFGNQTTQLMGTSSSKEDSSKQGCFPSKRNCNII